MAINIVNNISTMDLYHNIKAARDEKGVSQAEMARRLDLDPSAYHRLEHRSNKLSIEQATGIATVLGISLIELLTWKESKTEVQTEVSSKEAEQLQSRLTDLDENRKILQEYIVSLRFKLHYIFTLLLSTIRTYGENNNIGKKTVYEHSDSRTSHRIDFTDKELYEVFDLLYEENKRLYTVYYNCINRGIISSSMREAAIMLRHREEKDGTRPWGPAPDPLLYQMNNGNPIEEI